MPTGISRPSVDPSIKATSRRRTEGRADRFPCTSTNANAASALRGRERRLKPLSPGRALRAAPRPRGFRLQGWATPSTTHTLTRVPFPRILGSMPSMRTSTESSEPTPNEGAQSSSNEKPTSERSFGAYRRAQKGPRRLVACPMAPTWLPIGRTFSRNETIVPSIMRLCPILGRTTGSLRPKIASSMRVRPAFESSGDNEGGPDRLAYGFLDAGPDEER